MAKTDWTQPRTGTNAATALLESMRTVQQVMAQPPGLTPEQLVARLQEWQQIVTELAKGAEQGAELAVLSEMSQVLNSSLDLRETLNLVMDSLIHLMRAERGYLMLLDEERNLEVRATRNFDQGGVNPFELELSRTVVQEAMKGGGQPILTTNAQLDPRFSKQESVVGYQLRSIVCVPLRIRGRVTGALYLDNRMREGVFSEADLPTLTTFANQAAVAIENARLYTLTDQALAARVKELTTLQQFVCHELSTPTTAIRGFADMLEEEIAGPLTPQQAEFVRIINSEAERMQILASDLQDVSRIETDQLRLEIKPTGLTKALENALDAAQGQIEARSQQLTVDVPEDLPSVYADLARLEQILINLLSNARKYTPEGGHIRARAWRQDEYVHCAVSDTGIGISPEDQARLFTKYFRSKSPGVRKMPGTGLGLCIVKSLVELQGGEIEVESQLGEGTTITFTVPVAE